MKYRKNLKLKEPSDLPQRMHYSSAFLSRFFLPWSITTILFLVFHLEVDTSVYLQPWIFGYWPYYASLSTQTEIPEHECSESPFITIALDKKLLLHYGPQLLYALDTATFTSSWTLPLQLSPFSPLAFFFLSTDLFPSINIKF